MTLVYPQVVTGADLLRGINKLDYLAPLLKRRGAKAVAIVNSKLYGIRSFYKVMKKYGIRPVIGLSIFLEIEEGVVALLYVYAKDDEGYRNLLKMSSAVSVRESETLPLQWLKAYSKGCIIVCPLTDISWGPSLSHNEEVFQRVIKDCDKSSIFIGVARTEGVRHPDEELIEKIADVTNTPIVAVYESRYTDKEDAFAYEVAEAIRTGFKLNDPARPENRHKAAYLPEEAELAEWFSDRPEWLTNTSSILLACDAELPPSQSLMPVFPVPAGETATSLLEQNGMTGLQKRLGKVDEAYEKRLRYEISVIREMGFADYFLIVEDFMRYAKENAILTGPGRGSSAGSLVAYALGITDVDPIKYRLIFERFLNPGRVTMPDIDIDFADNRRAEVIDYVAQKYGKTNVAQIITFGTLSARSVARNVARVFDFSNEEMAYLSKEIPNRHGITLEAAVAESKALQDWIAIDPLRNDWLKAAIRLEGLPRNASTHAAGVILSPVPLVEVVPLQSGADGIYLTQWPMGDVEEQGLLKMDFLGLRNLTLLDRIRSMITYDRGIRLDFEKIPLNDEKTFELFRAGDMTGIFQFESDGMRDALRLIRPNKFEDIFAINALYRPGPMDNIPLYSRRKNDNEKIMYIHPQLESVLKETYGVIVYQEQIMEIAVRVAGFTMGEADLLRRAVSKKNRENLEKERTHFTQKALENGFPENSAVAIYDLIVKFADYGFPKSHAVAYSLISYRLAYLKANEPAYFYAALLSSMTGNNDKAMELMRESEAAGVKILPPSIKYSKYMYTVEKGSIRIGLGAIKGVTPTFYDAIKRARKSGGNWKTLFDMAASVGGDVFTEKAIRPLVKAGALDEFGESRAILIASIDAAISHALFIRPDDGDDLLSEVLRSVASPKYSPGGTLPRMTLLEYEREVLGFYLSEHPAAEVKKAAGGGFHTITSIDGIPDRAYVKMVGLITEIKRIRTKKGESMAFVTIQDETGQISCTLFPKQYMISESQLTEMAIIHVEGTVERRRGKPQILVQQTKGS
ncbi:DNA polymerase III subunit alpha [Sporosarcina sp. resist]|uniref:DNA polymerase III subunit alpha n=1 Tax=Sporosarcina sp. resist TaxID=2762563 RepID=UPI00164EC208|nr:DNA polymerase III subunit alpha [Sporosarcina sp. resist]QNK89733.1 DNA polymerase III subunit alpha [Sporosarcina sp. resist]